MNSEDKRNIPFKDKIYWANTWSRFRSGDKIAFQEMYSEYINKLYTYGLKLSGDKELVKDCIQDLFIDLFRYRIDLRQPESLEFYMFKALKRLIRKKLKKSRKISSYEEKDFLVFSVRFDLEDDLIRNETEKTRLKVLQNELNNLSQTNRELLFYKFSSNLSDYEIGQLIGKKPAAVRKQIYRIVKGLREDFKMKIPDLFLMCFIA